MAYKVQAEIQERFKQFIRYTARIAPIVVIVGAIGWFFLLRSPDGKANTSGSNDTPETTVTTTISGAKPEAKVPDSSTLAETTEDDGKGKDGKLPETGPADTLAIFAITATIGTLFWEWHLRRTKTNLGG